MRIVSSTKSGFPSARSTTSVETTGGRSPVLPVNCATRLPTSSSLSSSERGSSSIAVEHSFTPADFASELEAAEGKKIWIEDVHAHCLRALQTETQVMVKREDEQAFAELNGAYLKFVEDAARLRHMAHHAINRLWRQGAIVPDIARGDIHAARK